MAVSKVDAANQIENQLPQANVANNVNFRNIIINGSMDIRQRSDTTGFTGDAAYRSCDRWITRLNTLGTWDQEQSSTVPSGQGFSKSLKMTVDTADSSPAAGDFCWLEQRLEGQMLQYLKKGTSNAQQLTLSFWVRSSKTGTFIAQLGDADNSRVVSKSYTIDTADTWEKKIISFPADTTGTLDNDNNLSFQCKFFLAMGSNYTSGTLPTSWESSTVANWAVGQVNLADTANATFYLTGVQLEAGTSASDFEFLPHDVNLQRCQRYFHKTYDLADAIGNTSESAGYHVYQIDDGALQRDGVRFMTRMRSNPSVTIYNPFTGATASARTNAGNNYSVSTFSRGQCGFFVSYTPANGQFVFFHYTAAAEL